MRTIRRLDELGCRDVDGVVRIVNSLTVGGGTCGG
jgi:hypothetical protein